MAAESVALIYIDPPFNTGRTQSRKRIRAERAADGGRVGFGGNAYRTEVVGESSYADSFEDFTGFLRPRLEQAHRILRADGSLFFHIDWRESARCRLLLEEIFGGREHCVNEIIWAYDFGARSKSRWPAKHDNIYWFAKNPGDYVFNYDAMDRLPYIAPGLVSGRKGGARQNADRRVVADDCADQQPRKNRLSDSKSRWRFWSGLSKFIRAPAMWCWIFSPEAARPERRRQKTAAVLFWWTKIRRRWRR